MHNLHVVGKTVEIGVGIVGIRGETDLLEAGEGVEIPVGVVRVERGDHFSREVGKRMKANHRCLTTDVWHHHHEVPHRQFVFTTPKVLRGIFRKRRHLLTLLFHTATAPLQDAFRIRLGLPQGRIGAIAGVHTFGNSMKIA